ncbi:hypothetical protein ACSS6W_002074 [Trichoderma asperelloides]|nr:DUF500-domain-containing protein [Trichoderma asperelloides]
MQKVTSKLPSWDTTKTTSKKGFDKVWGWADKLGAPVNRLSNRIGSEAFWPTTLDKESDKAARILRSFCKDGFYAEEERQADATGPKRKQRVIKKIPQKVIENCVGLAIFTVMRTGLWVSGAGGSGVVVAKREDGSWSPPSGILLHTAGLGFLVGVDIYDCVLVINNRKALDAFTKVRATVGGEITAVAGPVGMGGVLENDGKWKEANRPNFTYLKSRGFYAGVQVDGSIIIERTDENARFYGETIGVTDILAGKVRHPPPELKMLMETLKAAEGRSDVDEELMEELEGQPAPGDVNVEAPSDKLFGIPEPGDPDPYGFLALQREGLDIVEAGTRSRPSSRQFEYHPSPSSPAYSKFHNRHSMETAETRSSRDSYASTPNSRLRWSGDPHYESSDAGTQTDEIITPITSPVFNTFQNRSLYEEPNDFYNAVNDSPWSSKGRKNSIHRDWGRDDSLTFFSEDDEKSEAAIISPSDLRSQSISAPPVDAVVPIKRVPPPLPPRNLPRPIQPEFEEVDLKATEEADREEITSSGPHSEFTTRETEGSTDYTSDAASVSPRKTSVSKDNDHLSNTIFDSDSHSLEINSRDNDDRFHHALSPYKSD